MKITLEKIIVFHFIFFIGVVSSQAQEIVEEKELVRQAVNTMFSGMQLGDSAMVRSVMSDEVIFKTVALREDQHILLTGSLVNFLKAVGTPHDRAWDERISNLQIQVDGPLATAWMDYSFYLGGNFTHCGVNAMTLLKSDKGWKIVYLVDTRRKDNCN